MQQSDAILNNEFGMSTVTKSGEKKNLNLIVVLNQMVDQENAPGQSLDCRTKSGHQQLQDNAKSILAKARLDNRVTVLGLKPCLISTLSLDGRGRAQRSMRVSGGQKSNFRPWHITWIAENGEAPLGLQYSHRCHNGNCVEPSHGTWEADTVNKDRWSCRGASHVVLPDGKCICICPHNPTCYRPLAVNSWADERFVNLPLRQ
jgi:hypothetical protein